MLCLGSLKGMKWRQLVWIAFCVLELAGEYCLQPTVPGLPELRTEATPSQPLREQLGEEGGEEGKDGFNQW